MLSVGLVKGVEMFKLSAIVLLVFTAYYIQCLPTQTSETDTTAKTGEKLQLYMNDGSDGLNYRLSPVMQNLDVEDQDINAELYAVLPYLNFLFGPDKGDIGIADCLDELEVQLVHGN